MHSKDKVQKQGNALNERPANSMDDTGQCFCGSSLSQPWKSEQEQTQQEESSTNAN